MKKIIALATLFAASVSTSAFAKNGEDAQALATAKITATQAIDIASAKVAGQVTAVDFDFKRKAQRAIYEVDIKNGNEKQEIRIDANTGEIVGTEMNRTDKPAIQATVSLKQAIETAQTKAEGKVKSADLNAKNGQTFYKVEMENGVGTLDKNVIIDANNGQVLDVTTDY